MSAQFLELLEMKCERCEGTGYVTDEWRNSRPTQRSCDDCHSRGLVPSEFGEAVLAFVKRNLSLQVTTHLK